MTELKVTNKFYHDYIFLQKVHRNNEFIHEGLSFHIIIPVIGNESAPNAVASAKKAMSEHLKKKKIEIPLYDLEYNGTRKLDSYHQKQVEYSNYCIIPIEGVQEKLG